MRKSEIFLFKKNHKKAISFISKAYELHKMQLYKVTLSDELKDIFQFEFIQQYSQEKIKNWKYTKNRKL